jgi:hypothetical protein
MKLRRSLSDEADIAVSADDGRADRLREEQTNSLIESLSAIASQVVSIGLKSATSKRREKLAYSPANTIGLSAA